MPLRITTLSLDGEAITDIPDDDLVLDMYYRYVRPAPGTVIMLYQPGVDCSVQYAEGVEDVVDADSGVDTLSVAKVDTIQYSDLRIVHVDAKHCVANPE